MAATRQRVRRVLCEARGSGRSACATVPALRVSQANDVRYALSWLPSGLGTVIGLRVGTRGDAPLIGALVPARLENCFPRLASIGGSLWTFSWEDGIKRGNDAGRD